MIRKKKALDFYRTCLCLLLFICSMNMMAQPAKISLSVKAVSLQQFFDEIEKKSNYRFSYRDVVLENKKDVTVNISSQPVEYILDRVLPARKLTYQVNENSILIIPATVQKPVQKEEKTSVVQITGTVVDAGGEPVIGASVLEKDVLSNGTVTGIDGKFTLSVSPEATLLVSYIGYIAKEVALGNQTSLSIVLEENTQTLDEVVVVGYGVQKKQSIVGSIVQQTSADIERAGHVTDLAQALNGQLPGVITILTSAEPGGKLSGDAGTEIYIRGRNTPNGGQPLILVDGVERNMNNIDPNEVETISVLKDASATAVFGVKGANGVILINTKRGKEGAMKLQMSYDGTAKMISKVPQKLNSYDAYFRKNEMIEREVGLSSNSWSEIMPMEVLDRYRNRRTPVDEYLYPDVDWGKAMFDDYSMSHRFNMSVSGGTPFLTYFASLAYLHEGDMFRYYDNHKSYDPNYNFDRFNFRSNFDMRITRTTKAKINLSGYYGIKHTYAAAISDDMYNGSDNLSYVMTWPIYNMSPSVYPVQFEDGSWGYTSKDTNNQNPIARLYNQGVRAYHTTELNSDFTLEQQLDFITRGLSVSGSFFYDNRFRTDGGIFDNANHIRPETNSNTPLREVFPDRWFPGATLDDYTIFYPQSYERDYDWSYRPWSIFNESVKTGSIFRRTMYQIQMNYARQFGKHAVTGTGVFKREEYAGGSEFKHYREDWIFRATYDFDSRYFLEANGAYNGSEQFGPGYRFAFFPSVAGGWYVSNEKFWKINWFSRLKARYSIGLVGDDKITGNRWLYASQYGSSGYRIKIDPVNAQQNSPYPVYLESVVGNPDLHWEKALKTNYGFDMGFLKNAVSLSLDYFTEKRTDIFVSGSSRAVPPFFGIAPPSANLGEIHAKGYEIDFRYNGHTQALNYWAALSYTHTGNKIINMDNPQMLDAYQKSEGFTLGQTKMQIADRIYKTWDEIYASTQMSSNDGQKLPGYYNIMDYNADGYIDSFDSAPVGYSNIPQNTYSFSLGAEYKGFAIMAQLYGSFNASRNVVYWNSIGDGLLFEVNARDYWSKDNPNAVNPLWRWRSGNFTYGDTWLWDASILRLQTAELSYTFNEKRHPWLKKANVSAMKLFVNGHNLFFWSDLPDDRENGDTTYPNLKRVTFGLNLSF